MPAQAYYALRTRDSDLTGGGLFTKDMAKGLDTPTGTVVKVLPPLGSSVDYGITPLNVPNNVHWNGGQWTLKVDVVVGDPSLLFSMRVQRISAAGVVKEETAFSPFSACLSGTVMEHSVGKGKWDVGLASDRIRVLYATLNLDGTFPHRFSYRTGGLNGELLSPIVENPMAAVEIPRVYLYDQNLQLIGQLSTASRIARSYLVTGVGRAQFSVLESDPQYAQLDPRLGRVIVIESSLYPFPWVGKLVTMSQSRASGSRVGACKSFASVLDQVRLPPSLNLRGTHDLAFRDVLQRVSTVVPTGIRAGEVARSSREVDLIFSRDQGRAALDQIANAGGFEWWLTHDVAEGRIDTYAHMQRWRGKDSSRSVALADPGTCQWNDWRIDGEAGAFDLELIGATESAALPLSDRTFGSASMSKVRIDAPFGYAVEGFLPSSPGLTRIDRALVAAQLRREDLVGQAAEAMLSRQSLFGFQRTVSVTANADNLTWPHMDVGSVIRLRLPSAFIGGFDGPARILGVQPDEESGQMDLDLQLLRAT